MESARLGLMLDASIAIEVERRGATIEQFLERIEELYGEVDIAISAITIAELVHGIYRARDAEVRLRRRAFIDQLKAHVPMHAITETTAEVIGRIGGESASQGIRIPFEDLITGAAALEVGYGVLTKNLRHFRLIPDLIVKDFTFDST